MAITTTQEKYAALRLNDWTWPAVYINEGVGDVIESPEKKLLMHGYPSITYNSDVVIVPESDEWLTRYRRRHMR